MAIPTSEAFSNDDVLSTTASTDATTNDSPPPPRKNRTPPKKKRRSTADPEEAYTPSSKRPSLSSPSTNPPRSRPKVGLTNISLAKIDDSSDEDYIDASNLSRSSQPRRPSLRRRVGTRSSIRLSNAPHHNRYASDSDSDGNEHTPRTCTFTCLRTDEDGMLPCDGQACVRVERKFHLACVGFRSMPPALLYGDGDGDGGVRWFCFECRKEMGMGVRSNGVVTMEEDGEVEDFRTESAG